MRRIKFLAVAAITLCATWLLNTHHPFGSSLPRLGLLFSPFHGFWQNAETGALKAADAIDLLPLNATVKVVFDERQVPHVFADNLEDGAFVQGYITASQRLFQMDIATRSASGRLSEIVGDIALENDRLQRRKGMVFAAENALASVKRSSNEYAIMEAYAAGVNAFIDQLAPRDFPIEFKLLNYAPEKWTVLQSMLMFKNMAATLCFGNSDLPATNARTVFGQELFDFLYPEHNPKQSPIIPETVKWNFTPLAPAEPEKSSAPMIGQLWKQPQMPQPPPFTGSNNWAVAGSKTAEGYPILCNDPHLNLTLPSIWYEIQLSTPDLNCYGVSLPGLPGIVIGFNENIAWGVTNVGHDVLDWYSIKWLDEAKTRYLYDDQPKDVRFVVEEIKVLGKKEPVRDTVRYTVWGPIVYEEPGNAYRDMAMRWLAHDQSEEKPFYEIGTFLGLMRARNYDDYSAALNGYDTPAQNFVFASKDGDIALKVNGRFPIRKPEQGRFIQDGSYSGNAWTRFIPRDQIPQVRNPERGFVSSANQQSAGLDYPYYYLGGFDDYRGRILNRLLDSMSGITIKDMMSLQHNSYSIVGEEATPVFLRLLPSSGLSGEETSLRSELEKWNFRYQYEAKAPLILMATLDSAYQLTFDEIFGRPDSIEMITPELWRFIDLLDRYPDHPIFDRQATPAREQAGDIVREAFRQVAKAWYGPLMKDENTVWGVVNAPKVDHLLRLPAFSRLNIHTDGYGNALNAVKGGHGPSWRMIVQLGPEVKAYGVYPGGQSGNPGSPFYDSMVDQWAKGDYNELFFMKNAGDKRKPHLADWTFK